MKTRIIAALALTALTGIANAADMPRYDVERQCDQVASMGGAGSYSLLEQCVKMETDAASKPKKFKF